MMTLLSRPQLHRLLRSRSPRIALFAGVALACAHFSRPDPDAMSTLAITHATVIDGTGAAPKADFTVVIRGGRIARVAPAGEVTIPHEAFVIDGRGRFLIPGLWDAHTHLSFAGEQALPLLVANGITGVRDVGSRLEEIRELQNRIATGEIVGPRIRTSGPIFESAEWMRRAFQIVPPDHPVWKEAPRVQVTTANAQALVDSLARAGVDFIKARNVSGNEFLALAAATERAHLPFASHTPAGVPMDQAADAGLDSFEHAETVVSRWGNAPADVRRRMYVGVAARGALVTPTLVADQEDTVSEARLQELIADTLGLLDVRNCTLPTKMRENWVEALRARRQTGSPSADEVARIAAEVRPMHLAGIRTLTGTDMGGVLLVYPGASVHDELVLLVRAGLTPMEALVSATSEPARFLRLSDSVGTIAPGKAADLLILDADPLSDIRNTRRIQAVVQAGHVISRTRLDLMLGSARCGRKAE